MAERIEDLLGRLTLEEKCAQLRYDAPAIERLGIPAYNWWNEALHGVGRAGRATVFPQAIGMAATWDAAFIETIAAAIADEARAKHHECARRGSRQIYQGLTFWTPNINIFRDPRWGRGQETWGEDPFLTGTMGAAFVRGLQGDDPKYLKVAACAKHYAVHSGPEAERHNFDACPSKKDLEETYFPAFERLVKEGVESVMGAYNAVYGLPANGSPFLLEETLRQRWGFEGHVVSDCWAIRDFHQHYKVTDCAEASAAMALKAGCDLNCGSVYCSALLDAVKMGLCSEADVDRALRRLLRTRFRLGMFDPEDAVAYAKTPMSMVGCQRHRNLALEAARRSLVLLKNANDTLPIPATAQTLTVVGPFSGTVEVLMGNYFGLADRMVTVLEGIAGRAPDALRIEYRKGCLSDRPNDNKRDWSFFEALKSDFVVAAMGISPNMEGEEGDAIQSPFAGDREHCGLPQNQLDYLLGMAKAIRENGKNTRMVVLLFGGSALVVPELQEYADAIVHVWYPGEAGGTAIAELLFGDLCPEGRMPITVPRSMDALPDFRDYSMAGRTYKYMQAKDILYPFGYGLSFTQFAYDEPSRCDDADDDAIQIAIPVRNCGPRAGGEIVQCYARFPQMPDTAHCTLVAFQRVFLEPGQQSTVQLSIPKHQLQVINADGERQPPTGPIELCLGGHPPIDTPVLQPLPRPKLLTLTC